MFDRDEGLPQELISSIFSFFTPTQSARIATTCKLFNQQSLNRVNELNNKVNRSPLLVKVLLELEKRCTLYSYQGSYYMEINAYDFNCHFGRTPNKVILQQDLIQKLIEHRDFYYYFYSIDGKCFYGMKAKGYVANANGNVLRGFAAHETDSDKPECQIFVDNELKHASVVRDTLQFFESRRPDRSQVYATYHLAHPLEKRMILSQLLTNESQLIPVKYYEKLVCLLRCDEIKQFIFVLSVGNGINHEARKFDHNYKVLIGNLNHRLELPIEHVDYFRDDETVNIVFDRECGYQSLLLPPSYGDDAMRILTTSDQKKMSLSLPYHSTSDSPSIRSTLDQPKPVSTLLDWLKANELETKQARLK